MADPFLYERVYDYVLDEIRRGSLAAGDRVPSEMDLAARFGVSRITSKRALHMLAEAGVLQRRRGKGTFVADNIDALRTVAGQPGAVADQATSTSTACVGLVIPDASDAYGLELLRAIEERCAERGYHLVVRRTRDRQDVEEQAVRALVDSGIVDGLIVFPVHGEYYNASLLRLVVDHQPLVLVDRYLRGIPACSVHTDNRAAARELTGRLLDQGHERIAFCSPPVANPSSIEERMEGFEAALAERGLPADAGPRCMELQSSLPGLGDASEWAADRAAIREFVERESDVTGFVASEYNIALLVREVLAELGPAARAGRVIGCFDSPTTPASGAGFLHVEQDQRGIGRRAVDLLLAQLDGDIVGDAVPLRSIVPFRLVDPAGQDQASRDLLTP